MSHVLAALMPEFLSTPSARRATLSCPAQILHCMYFYPRPPRGGRPLDFWHYADNYNISIHALREEGDPAHVEDTANSLYFYPRPPRGGRHE